MTNTATEINESFIYEDTWAGAVRLVLVTFKTTRRGERVLRYRWSTNDYSSIGLNSPSFGSEKGAIAWAKRHARITNVSVL